MIGVVAVDCMCEFTHLTAYWFEARCVALIDQVDIGPDMQCERASSEARLFFGSM